MPKYRTFDLKMFLTRKTDGSECVLMLILFVFSLENGYISCFCAARIKHEMKFYYAKSFERKPPNRVLSPADILAVSFGITRNRKQNLKNKVK